MLAPDVLVKVRLPTLVSTFMIPAAERIADVPEMTLAAPLEVMAPADVKVDTPPVIAPLPEMVMLSAPAPAVVSFIVGADTVPVTLIEPSPVPALVIICN